MVSLRPGERPLLALYDALSKLLGDPPEDVTWIPVDLADPAAQGTLKPVRDVATTTALEVVEAARTGAAREAIDVCPPSDIDIRLFGQLGR